MCCAQTAAQEGESKSASEYNNGLPAGINAFSSEEPLKKNAAREASAMLRNRTKRSLNQSDLTRKVHQNRGKILQNRLKRFP